jgi:hypothetical protein
MPKTEMPNLNEEACVPTRRMAFEARILAERTDSKKPHVCVRHVKIFDDEDFAYNWVNMLANKMAKHIGKTYRFVRGTCQMVEVDENREPIQRIGSADEVWFDAGAQYEMRLRMNQ